MTVLSAGNLALNVAAPIATDNIVNIAEKAAGFDIGGDTGSVGGASVTVTVGGTDLAATSAEADPATWTVRVPAAAAYISGTSVAVTVSAVEDRVHRAGRRGARDLAVDLVAPTAPAYTAPGSLQVGEAIAAMNPAGGTGIDEYSAAGLPSGLTIDSTTGAIIRHAGHCRGGRRRDGDGERQRRQHRHGGHRVPGGGEGRPGARRVRLRGLLGEVRYHRTHVDRAERRANGPGILGRAGGGVHRGRHQRRARAAGGRGLQT